MLTHNTRHVFSMNRLAQLTLIFAIHFVASQNAVAQNATVAEKTVRQSVAATDNGTPGIGPIRKEDWFQKTWRERRAKFAEQKSQQKHALVFLGDSITQGWGDDFRGKFPHLKVANRGISGDTSRGLLARLDDDVLALDPSCIVLLIGTNDVELKVPPEGIAA